MVGISAFVQIWVNRRDGSHYGYSLHDSLADRDFYLLHSSILIRGAYGICPQGEPYPVSVHVDSEEESAIRLDFGCLLDGAAPAKREERT